MIKGVSKLNNLDLPFATEDVLTVRVGLTEDYSDLETRVRFYDELERRIAASPGVASVTFASSMPWLGSGNTFYAHDGESFARRDFPGEDALGKRIRRGRSDTTEEWATIVGIVPDLRMNGIGDNDNEQPQGMYFPVAQIGSRFLTAALRARGDPLDLASVVRDEVSAMDKEVPVYWVQTMTGGIGKNTWFYNTFGTLFLVFGAVALFLASVGLYGVMSFAVSRRTREVGIRMALGAQSGQVPSLILRQSFSQIAIGLVVGLGIAAVLSRGMALLFFETEPWDPAIFLLIAAVLATSGFLASLIPARRATRIDPMEALRYK